jgi:hypothetical protein
VMSIQPELRKQQCAHRPARPLDQATFGWMSEVNYRPD